MKKNLSKYLKGDFNSDTFGRATKSPIAKPRHKKTGRISNFSNDNSWD